jgi:hypothetical protein
VARPISASPNSLRTISALAFIKTKATQVQTSQPNIANHVGLFIKVFPLSPAPRLFAAGSVYPPQRAKTFEVASRHAVALREGWSAKARIPRTPFIRVYFIILTS